MKTSSALILCALAATLQAGCASTPAWRPAQHGKAARPALHWVDPDYAFMTEPMTSSLHGGGCHCPKCAWQLWGGYCSSGGCTSCASGHHGKVAGKPNPEPKLSPGGELFPQAPGSHSSSGMEALDASPNGDGPRPTHTQDDHAAPSNAFPQDVADSPAEEASPSQDAAEPAEVSPPRNVLPRDRANQ